jgi:ribosomal-protein-alanine N-acetyltransferase
MDRLQEIITENFLLREIDSNDINAVYEIFSDSKVIRYWDHIAWVDLSEAANFIQEAHSGFTEYKHFCWCVCKKDTGVIVGVCALRDYSQDHRTIEILYALLPEYWGKEIGRAHV